jgi:predicted Zn-dependent peptidase
VDVTARPGVSAERLEAAVSEQIDRFRTDGATEVEVSRAIALIETAFISSLQSAGDRADKLSQFATYCGDPSLVNVELERYGVVKAMQVSAFANKYLGEDNRVSLMYMPRAQASAMA